MLDEDNQFLEERDNKVGTSGELPNPAADDDPSQPVRPEVRQGSLPGNERIDFVRPGQSALRRLGYGLLEATEVTEAPQGVLGRIKRLLIGVPIPTSKAENERLTKFKALAVLSSDAISSVAYATEAILLALVVAGSRNLGITLPISFAIVALIGIVALSYRQTIPAYPNGGGSYIVAKENLGTVPGLVAAASLMIDYVLTVSVSVAAGVQALATLFPALSPTLDVVTIDVVLVLVIALANLRGVRESGSIFALPTYLFIVSALLLIVVGGIKSFFLVHQPVIGHFQFVAATEPLSLFLILKAFAAGCSAMTGIEAISNGVPAFKKPEPRNAATTLTWMAVILGTLFLGITLLATSYHVEANAAGNPTVIGQIAQQVFTGPLFFLYPVFQLATLLVLTLAANTSYSDFPRLASLLARDDFLPHQFAFRGDRLAFSTGIVSLAILASLLLILFHGDPTQLINLYAVGVFMSFTLSQSGMVRHWWRLRREHAGWQRSLVINGSGAATTLLVASVIASTKFLAGAWIVVVLIPLLVVMFLGIRLHYLKVERELTTSVPLQQEDIHHLLLVPIASLNPTTRFSLAYARSISPHVTAVHIASRNEGNTLRTAWEDWQKQLSEDERSQLNVIEPSHRTFLRSLLDYINTVQQQHPGDTLTVILPEPTASSLLGHLLHHPKVLRMNIALFFRPEIVVTNIALWQQSNALLIRPKDIHHHFIIPFGGEDRASVESVAYAHSISHHVIAAHVAIDPHDVELVRSTWERLQKHLTQEGKTGLVVIESPYRSLTHPLLAYIDAMRALYPDETLTVILPEFVVAHWWEYPLHNQTAFRLKAALFTRPGIVVTDIPQHLSSRQGRK
jgi:amino acid transporter